MKIEDAIKRAGETPVVKQHEEKGYYLTSLLATPETFDEIKAWTLIYFHPEDMKVFSITINPKGVEIGEASAPLVEAQYQQLEYSKAMAALDVLKSVKPLVKDEKPTHIILTLREGKWLVAVVTRGFKIIRVDMDSESGKVLNFDVSSLVRIEKGSPPN
jgi:hypothetical protein